MDWADPALFHSESIMESNMHFAERDQLLQKYTYLVIECERLKSRMTSTLATYSSFSPTSAYYNGTALPPLSSYQSKSPSPPISSPQSRRQSTSGSIPAHPEPHHASYHTGGAGSPPASPAEDELDEQALLRIQQQIKAILTGLLNCKDVKGDQTSRAWVQQRLMEAEHDMRSGKRRRRSGCDAGIAAGAAVGGVVRPLMNRRNVT